MLKQIFRLLQAILYLLSPFFALSLAELTRAVSYLFLATFVCITISQWLAIHQLGKIIENDSKKD